MVDSEYVRTVERSFSDAPFRLEWRAYAQPNTSSAAGVWQLMHKSNGAIIATGATPLAAISSLTTMAERMDNIRRGLPYQGRNSQ